MHLICIALQYAILLTIVVTIQMKYVLHIIDLRSENPWDNKAVYLLYTELITGKRKTNSAVIVTCMFMSLRFKMFEHDRRKEQKQVYSCFLLLAELPLSNAKLLLPIILINN